MDLSELRIGLAGVKHNAHRTLLQLLKIYRKIPNISPGLIDIFKHILGGLYSGGLIFGGAYIRRAFWVSNDVSNYS